MKKRAINSNHYIWQPCIGVGKFVFGSPIMPLISKYNLTFVHDDTDDG